MQALDPHSICQKSTCAEGRVAVPTAGLCKAGLETKYLPTGFGALRSGPGRGPESPTAGPPSVPPGRPHPRERRQARGGRPATARPPGATPNRREGCFMTRGCSIRKKPRARSRTGAMWVRFCGSRLWRHKSDAPEFGRIRVQLRVWAQALSGRGASSERVCATMQQDHTMQHRTT